MLFRSRVRENRVYSLVGASPNAHPLSGGEPHRVIGANIECRIKLVDIGQNLITAELGRGVRIDYEHLGGELDTRRSAPHPRPRVEEALRPGDGVNDGGRLGSEALGFKSGDPRRPRDRQTAEIPDVLPDGERAINSRRIVTRQIRWGKAVVLVDKGGRKFVEAFSLDRKSVV